MENHVTVRQKIDNLPDKTLALLGLQSNTTTPKTVCPTDAELADFIQGKLKGQAREKMLEHLDQCPDCYQHWMDELRMAPKKPPEPTPEEVAWWRKLGEILHLNQPWQLPTYFATAVVLAVLIHNIMPSLENGSTPDVVADNDSVNSDTIPLSSVIAANYQNAIAQDWQVKRHNVPTMSAYGLGSVQPSNGSEAYKLCLVNSFDALENKKLLLTKFDTQYHATCELAQWVAFSLTALHNSSQLEPAFWQQQLQQSQRFEQQFQHLPQVTTDLQEVSIRLQQIIDDPDSLKSPTFIEVLQRKLESLSKNRF